MRTAFALFTLLIAAPLDALACSCIPPQPIPESVDGATRVFLGKVVSLKRDDVFGLRVTFQVSEHFKGKPVDTLWVETAADGAMCGYPFQKGLAYVVYAHGEEGALRAHTCSRTTLAQPGSDLETLRAGK